MKTDFYLEVGSVNFRGDFEELCNVPLYYSGLKLADGTRTSLGGLIVANNHFRIIDILETITKDNEAFTEACLKFKNYTVAIFKLVEDHWELS